MAMLTMCHGAKPDLLVLAAIFTKILSTSRKKHGHSIACTALICAVGTSK